jgi:hypothetical protein
MKHCVAAGFLGVVFYVVLTTVLAAEPVDSRVLATSPDHPRTFWTGGFEERDRYVVWNATEGALEAHVVYGVPSYTDSWNPVLYDHFKARFPGVHLDARRGRLYVLEGRGREVTIGHLEPGVYGTRVELEKSVDLLVHRHDGHLDAALVKGTK